MSSKHPKKKTSVGKSKSYRQFLIPAVITVATTVIAALIIGYFKGDLWQRPPMRASLDKPTVDTDVSLRDFLDDRKVPTSDYTKDQLAQVGYVVHFKVQIEGLKRRKCTARWEVFDAQDRSRILPPGWSKEQEPVEMIPERDIDSAAENFWVPPTGTDRVFFVRVRIYDDKGVELVYADSDPLKPVTTKQGVETSALPEANANSAQPAPSDRK